MATTAKKAARVFCFDVGDRVQETVRGSVGTVVQADPHGVTVQLDAELDTVRKHICWSSDRRSASSAARRRTA